MALDKKGIITSWDLLSGKITGMNKLKKVTLNKPNDQRVILENNQIDLSDYSRYEIFGEEKDYTYRREHCQPKSLIVVKDED